MDRFHEGNLKAAIDRKLQYLKFLNRRYGLEPQAMRKCKTYLQVQLT